jgi:cell division septum initiation protein DivIVA
MTEAVAEGKLKIAADINRFLRMFSGLAEVSEKLVDVGSLEQAALDAQARLVKLGNAAQKVKAAQAEAESIVAGARSQADEILASAKADAQSMRDKAQAKANEVVAKAQADADAHEERGRQAQHQAAAAGAAHRDAMAGVQEAKAEQARVEQLVAAMKAKF